MPALPLLAFAAAQALPAAPPAAGALPPRAVDCILKRGRRRVVDLLVTEPAAPAEAAALQALATVIQRCGASSPAGDGEAGAALRAALSRTLVTRMVQRVEMGPNSNPDFSPDHFRVERGYDHAGVMQRPYRLADCMASVNLVGVANVSGTQPGSPAEREALRALAPTLSSCVDRNQQLALSPRLLRIAIDIVYARRTLTLLRSVKPGR
ncbi:MAG TPA: hypothetical protein VGW34_00625 [Allosphingosinicella sp.]|nr:hypothetical protein [Allosphingosinicella sp.]